MTQIVKQNLSKNIICLWKIKKEIKPINNYNIISCVFFIKKESYKHIDNYINGLTNIINNFKNILPTYRLRIYHDSTVKEILDNILNNKLNDIELYEYDISVFKDGIYHKGVIGTFIRFLPLFDLEYHKVDNCIVFDIDNKIHNYYRDMINYFKENDVKIAYRSRFCYISKRIMCTKNKYPIIASFIYQSIQIPYKILSKFFEKLYIKNDIDIISKCDIDNIYEYGIDEFFMNKYYIKYLNKHNIDRVLVLYNHIDIVSGFKKFFKNYCNKQKTTDYIWKIMYDFFNIINININKLYNYKELNNELILEMLVKNKRYLESQLIKIYKNNSENKLKYLRKYILDELDKLLISKKTKILLKCILNNMNININKINLVNVTNKINLGEVTNEINYIYLDIL